MGWDQEHSQMQTPHPQKQKKKENTTHPPKAKEKDREQWKGN